MFLTRPEIAGTFGVAASTHWTATAVAMAVLERGGNAADAAVAAGFVLQVVEPHLNGPGGDCPIIVHDAKTNAQSVICGQGVAPAGLSVAHVKGHLGLDLVPGTGLLPAMVPGNFDAFATLLRDHGTMRLPDLLAYAIGYAQNGAHMVPRVVATLETVRPLFEAEWPTSAALWLRDGGPRPGALWANPTLAATWTRVLKEAARPDRLDEIEAARNVWYKGFVAEAIGRFFASTEALDASGRRHRGVLTADDMAAWRAPVEAPAAYTYRGHTVLKAGAWSQGPAHLQTLALLQGFDIAGMDPLGEQYIHTIIECMKLAWADREAFYGDPNFCDVPLNQLLSEEYNIARRALVTDEASLVLRPGRLPDRDTPWVDHGAEARAAILTSAPGVGEPTVARLGASGGDTCHLDVIDRWGNMVSVTPSGGWLQSSPAVPELGFCLGTRGQMFWLDENLPNGLKPGKRPRTTLSPGMVLRDGKAWMSFGTPGGEQQDQWQTVMLTRMVDHAMGIQEAIDAPSFHSEHWPSSFWPRVARPGKAVVEGRFPPEVAAALEARGHRMTVGGDWSEGRLSGARLEPDGQMFAGANPRGMQGYAAGR
ncbi:gamma-glutamyltransferase family protein [Humitalea sp. 24SJ18S-53]|uniref:gamma-glutamyltransferase family protein n=1 Tax=Humitalea sp. 24SJ18S-53 TaxID=3422307 RepID=UPI003D6752DA